MNVTFDFCPSAPVPLIVIGCIPTRAVEETIIVIETFTPERLSVMRSFAEVRVTPVGRGQWESFTICGYPLTVRDMEKV